jgi:hypothetical protein
LKYTRPCTSLCNPDEGLRLTHCFGLDEKENAVKNMLINDPRNADSPSRVNASLLLLTRDARRPFGSNLSHYLKMSYRQHTVIAPNGEVLTGKTWRKQHSFFNDLPFYTNIPRMDKLAGPLQIALGDDGCHRTLLVVSY